MWTVISLPPTMSVPPQWAAADKINPSFLQLLIGRLVRVMQWWTLCTSWTHASAHRTDPLSCPCGCWGAEWCVSRLIWQQGRGLPSPKRLFLGFSGIFSSTLPSPSDSPSGLVNLLRSPQAPAVIISHGLRSPCHWTLGVMIPRPTLGYFVISFCFLCRQWADKELADKLDCCWILPDTPCIMSSIQDLESCDCPLNIYHKFNA